MNKIKIFLLMLIFFTSSYAQEEVETKNKKIDSLFSLVKKTTPDYKNSMDTEKVHISDYDLEKARELLYYSYAHATMEYRQKKKSWYKEWEKTGRKGIKPAKRMKLIEEALVEKYGKDYVGLLKTPYFMKVKIIDVTRTSYPSGRISRGRELLVPQMNSKVEVLDVLKGGNYYSIGDTITIAYLPLWFQEGDVSPNFEIGKEYALPLNIWNNQPPDVLKLRLQGLHTLYQVENSVVYSPLISKKDVIKLWDDFKVEFEQHYLINE